MTSHLPLAMFQQPVTHFDIRPTIGAMPVTFGMHRDEVHCLLGPPTTSGVIWDKSGFMEGFLRRVYNVGYDNEWNVNHVGFGPGPVALSIEGKQIWSVDEHPDPNPILLALDSAPLRRAGILIYLRLGITVSGYRYGDRGNGVVTVNPPSWVERLVAHRRRADLTRSRDILNAPLSTPKVHPVLHDRLQ